MPEAPQEQMLAIAGLTLQLRAVTSDVRLASHPSFSAFLCPAARHADFTVDVHRGTYTATTSLPPVFTAENIPGFPHAGAIVWQIFQYGDDYLLETTSEGVDYQLLFRLDTRHWTLYVDDGKQGSIRAFVYPLDGLLVYLMLNQSGGVLLHASGVNYHGHGLVFAGFSGRGKSTIARLFKDEGATVINDDRLALRQIDGSWQCFNTPMFYADQPRQGTLSQIFLLEHGQENYIEPLQGTGALTSLMAFCIQHHYHRKLVHGLLNELQALTKAIEVARLVFRPDCSVVQDVSKYLQHHDT